jgi:hypothetical protein
METCKIFFSKWKNNGEWLIRGTYSITFINIYYKQFLVYIN